MFIHNSNSVHISCSSSFSSKNSCSSCSSNIGALGRTRMFPSLMNHQMISTFKFCSPVLLRIQRNQNWKKIWKLPKWHFWTRAWNSKCFLAERLFLKCYEDDIYIKGCFIYILDSSNSSSFKFWSSQFATSSRSNWTGNSNGTWTDKQTSHFSKKKISVKAKLFFM